MNHYPIDRLEPRHIENLRKLAEYLESLPDDYARFSMMYFNSTRSSGGATAIDLDIGCGTVACAAGHGPAAGIAIPPQLTLRGEEGALHSVNWNRYCASEFGTGIALCGYGHALFMWLFDMDWADYDNTHKGAAQRIRYALKYGVPKATSVRELAKLQIPRDDL